MNTKATKMIYGHKELLTVGRKKSKDKTDPEQIKTRETGQKAERRHIHNLQGPQGRGHRYTKQPTLYLFSSARQMFTILVKRTPRKDKENKQFGAIWA